MKSNPIRMAIIRACVDAEYRARLLANPPEALAEEGLDVPAGVHVVVHEPGDDTIVLVLPGESAPQIAETSAAPPDGPVADVPAGLTMTWADRELTLSGRIDGATAPALKRELLRCFTDVWVQMASVDFLSSAGIGVLLAAHRHLSDHDATMYLVSVPEPVLNVLEMVGLSDAFEIVEPLAPYGMHDAFGWRIGGAGVAPW